MGKPFSISVQGLNKLQQRMRAAPAKLKKEINGELEAGAKSINAKQVRATPVDEGGIRQTTVVSKSKDLEYALLSSKRYAPFMEFGTKSRAIIPAELQEYAKQFNLKGPNIGFKAFYKIIRDWTHRKGIDEKAAYPIAISILKHGVNPHPFFFSPYLKERPQIIARVQKILDEI